jgi:glycosyltransferase involved in cell wall biosynthesis
MNILILTTHLNTGGISRYVINLARGLKSLGHTVWIGSDKGEWLDELAKNGIGYKFIPIKTKAILSPKVFLSFFYLAGFLKQEKIQIVHANTRVTQFLAWLIFKIYKTPYVSAFHGFFKPGLTRKLFKLAGNRSIAVSKAVKNYLVNDLKFDPENIRVVYNGVDEKYFSVKNKRKADYGFSDNDFLIGILGRISEEKGHFLALDAIKELSVEHPNIHLIVAGRGRLEKNLKKFIEKINCRDFVTFYCLDAGDFLDIIDVLIMPSRKEGFGYAVVEAFFKKVPVVGFNVGGIAEIIKNRVNGLLFYEYTAPALKNAVEELIANRDLREGLTRQGYQDAFKFSLEAMARGAENVYKEILEPLR